MEEELEKKPEEAIYTDVETDDCKCGCNDKKHQKEKKAKGNGELSTFILGLLSVVVSIWSPILSIIGFILGIIAVVKGHKLRHLEEKPGYITAGWIMGIIGMVISGIAIVLGLSLVVHIAHIAIPYYYHCSFWF